LPIEIEQLIDGSKNVMSILILISLLKVVNLTTSNCNIYQIITVLPIIKSLIRAHDLKSVTTFTNNSC